jgi:hypothetical protein
MADFRTHMTISTLAGVAYGVAGYRVGVPLETCAIAGGLCSVSGMLPDLDSDSGIPLREAIGFASALVPMLMVERLNRMGLNFESMVLVAGLIYLFIRFVVAEIFRRYTVHRGMWHSIPAALLVGMFSFLVCSSEDIAIRLFKTAAVVLGFTSHLLLDEIWSIEFRRGRYEFKSSFGTALKLWSDNWFANFTTYALVLAFGFLVYSDEGFMKRFGYKQADVPHTAVQLLEQLRDESQKWLRR